MVAALARPSNMWSQHMVAAFAHMVAAFTHTVAALAHIVAAFAHIAGAFAHIVATFAQIVAALAYMVAAIAHIVAHGRGLGAQTNEVFGTCSAVFVKYRISLTSNPPVSSPSPYCADQVRDF